MSKKAWAVLAVGVIGGLALISIAIFELFFTAKEVEVSRPPTPVEEDYSKEFTEVFKTSQQALNLNAQLADKKGDERERAIDKTKQKLRERKKGLIDLMQKDPNLAWTIIYPPAILQQIPKELQDEVEQPITIKAELDVWHTDDFAGGKSKFFYYLNIENNGQLQKIPFYIVGTAPGVLSGSEVEVHGYKLGDNIIASAQGGTINVIKPAKQESLGTQRTLVVLVNFLNSKQPLPISRKETDHLVFHDRIKKFFSEASYNKTSFNGEVTDWLTLPRIAKPEGPEGQKECKWPEVEEVYPLIKNKFNLKNYDRLILLTDSTILKESAGGTTFCFAGGDGTVGKKPYKFGGTNYSFSVARVAVDSYSLSEESASIPSWRFLDLAISHELGHNLGVYHANSWECPGGKIFGTEDCSQLEYGNKFDVMGAGHNSLHFNAFFKEVFGWLGADSSLMINKPGTYSLNPIEEDEGVRLAKIQNPKNNTFPFYLEYRRAINFDSNLDDERLSANQNGLFVNWIPKKMDLYSRLLDMSPQSAGDPWDVVTLPQGNQIFEDFSRGIRIGPVREANSRQITFDVGFFDPKCRRLSPEIIEYGLRSFGSRISLRIAPGDLHTESFSILNRDGPVCGISKFEILSKLPKGWRGGIMGKTSIKLTPESDPAFNSYFVIVPKDTKLGDYTIKLVVNNLDSGLKGELSLIVKVVEPGSSDVSGGGTGGRGAPPAPKTEEAPPSVESPAPTVEPSPAPTEKPAAAPEGREQPLGISGFVADFYKWALGIGALIALLVLIYGGIVYTTSAGNESRIGEAKEWVFGAVIGLFLLFGSYLILNTINPELVKLKDITLEKNKPADSSQGKLPSPTPDNPVSVPLIAFPFGEGVALREAGISCNDYGACPVHTEGCALLNESGAFCRNNVVGSGNCGTKINSTLVNNLLAARDAGFNIYVTSSVCSTSHGEASFHYRLLGADLNLPSSDDEIRRLMTFLNSTSCIHDLWGPARFGGLCVDEGRKGVACFVPNHESHLHYDVQPNCK